MKRLLALYLARLTGYAAYGAVGAVLALLTWIYVLSLLTFFGAEMTRVYAERFGSLSKPRLGSLQQPREHVDDRRREPGAPPERHSLT
jgi:membrane protein